jgi:hypothetical protein
MLAHKTCVVAKLSSFVLHQLVPPVTTAVSDTIRGLHNGTYLPCYDVAWWAGFFEKNLHFVNCAN